jgi:hypothetical protein
MRRLLHNCVIAITAIALSLVPVAVSPIGHAVAAAVAAG